MSGYMLLIAAYALVWVCAFGYLAWLASQQERLRREVEALRKSLSMRGDEPPGSRGR